MSMLSYFQLSYTLTIVSMIMQRTHLLMSLLCLEGMMLSMVLLIPSTLYLTNMLNISTLAIIMLTLGACEASLGLSIMVTMSRSSGSDMIMSLTTNKC